METAAEIPSILATLCSSESWLGPYHPRTLRVLVELGKAFQRDGDTTRARQLLERATREIARHLGPHHQLRIDALRVLAEVLVEESEFGQAATVREELGRAIPLVC